MERVDVSIALCVITAVHNVGKPEQKTQQTRQSNIKEIRKECKMNYELIAWILLGLIGLFDIWLVITDKESISKWTERRWPRSADIAIAISLIVIKSGILGIGGNLYSFDPVLFMLVGHMLLGHELYGSDRTKQAWSGWERWCVYGCAGVLAGLAIITLF